MARVFGPEYPANEVVSIDIVTEQNSTSISKKAGWGFVGSVALGPLGLLAGVLGGGNKYEKIVAIEFTDGKRALLRCDAKSYGEMMRLTFRKKSEPQRRDALHALPSGFRKSVDYSPDAHIENAPTTERPGFMNGVTVSFAPKSSK